MWRTGVLGVWNDAIATVFRWHGPKVSESPARLHCKIVRHLDFDALKLPHRHLHNILFPLFVGSTFINDEKQHRRPFPLLHAVASLANVVLLAGSSSRVACADFPVVSVNQRHHGHLAGRQMALDALSRPFASGASRFRA